MRIIEDTRQQAGKHAAKHEWWAIHGHEIARHKIDVGDYVADVPRPSISVDTKASLSEVATNISRNHHRFRREMTRARDAGVHLVILVETDEATTLADVVNWVNDECGRCMYYRTRACDPTAKGKCSNPRHHKSSVKPIQGERLARAMLTMSERYGCEFMFCSPKASAAIITNLLARDYATAA